ncbi:hypothetical protein SmJEL517_g06009 [Synchytrium microbalum]|uniref:Uncharacterized protein n=1 Tax=Synchytrium microbalum TaxID=1806994 RepID=A0A507BSX2_9FUNG|nr:uncharacterized protein SmJEL517_g06009 [Synchytrium microbalum]TPX30421.1 hypothetical protein SmJEL517_g06009 [Synchytrium microbalum]
MAINGKGPHNHLRHDSKRIQMMWNIGYLCFGYGIPLLWVLFTIPVSYVSPNVYGCGRSWLPTINASIVYILYGVWMTCTFILRLYLATSSVVKLITLRNKTKHLHGSKTAGVALLARFVAIDFGVLTSSLNTVANIMFGSVVTYSYYYNLYNNGSTNPNTIYYFSLLVDWAYTKSITGVFFSLFATLFAFVALATGAGAMAKYFKVAAFIGRVTGISYLSELASKTSAVDGKKAVTIKNMARLLNQTSTMTGSTVAKEDADDKEVNTTAPPAKAAIVASAPMGEHHV